MPKLDQAYGVGKALIPVLPPPIAFENAPTSSHKNYAVGQIVFTPGPNATAFYIYAGNGVWSLLDNTTGTLLTLTTQDSTVVVPTAGNVNISGAGSTTTVGSGSTATVELTGLTNHAVLVGAGTTTITKLALGTTGQVLTGTTASDPAFAALGTNSGLTTDGILLGGGAGPFTATAALTSGQTLVGVTGGVPVAQTISNNSVTSVPRFTGIPSMSASTGGVAAVTINTYNIWSMPEWSARFEQYNTTVSTNIAPSMSATAGRGLNIDNITGAVSKSIEITEGNNVNSKNAFVIGTSAAFYVKAGFTIVTLADIADLYVGFREVQTYQATIPAGYTDYATIGVHGATGEIQTQTQVGSGGNIIHDTTQAITAATNFTVEVLVSATGVVTYLLNGVAPTSVAAYTFTSAITVIPYIIYTTPAGGHAEVDLGSYVCGLQ